MKLKLEHVAIIVSDLEKMKTFYTEYFAGTSSKKYENKHKNFTSYFIEFNGDSKIELMHLGAVKISSNTNNNINGINHLAFSTSSKDEVVYKLQEAKIYGLNILEEPRLSGLGYYVGTISDPEGNKIEILYKNLEILQPHQTHYHA